MKKYAVVISVVVALAALLFPTGLAQAQFKPSVAAFYGNVTLDGVSVADGTEVSAWMAKSGALKQVASTVTPSDMGKSTYILKIVQPTGDDFEGKTLEFRVGGYIATPSGTWYAGGSTSLDLAGSTKAKPAATATPAPAATPLPPKATSTPAPPTTTASTAIELYKGWNLIGVPQELDLSKDALKTVVDSGGYKAWYYWPADGAYYGSNYLYPGYGYWVESSDRATVYIQGGQLADVTLDLAKGWNLISTPVDISVDLIDKVVGLNYSGAYGATYYYPVDGAYYGSNTLMAGWGYWIEAKSAGKVLIARTKASIGVP